MSSGAFTRRFDGPLTRGLARRPAGFGIGQVPAGRVPDAVARSVCGFCSTGCSLDLHLQNGRAVGITPTERSLVNLGRACPKGWQSLDPLSGADRLTEPLLRDRRGRLRPASWPEALDAFTNGFRAVQANHGDDAVAFLSTGQIPTEEMALLGALAKFGMGIVHGDGNTRQCMATSVAAYKEAFGFDAPPYTYADFELSDTIVLVGSNLAIAHPIMWERASRNRRDPELVVVDPRATETASAATLHLGVKPKSDPILFFGIGNILIERGWVDCEFVDAHTSGFADYRDFVQAFTPDRVAVETGIGTGDLLRFADSFEPGRAVSLWWTMGVNQSHQGVRTAQAIIDVALLTGNIGKPGTGANSITGQCNAMGSRLWSNTTNLFCGRNFADPGHRLEVATALGIDQARVPDRGSWPYDRIIEGIHRGEIRGLWIVATNTAHSWINQTDTRTLLSSLEFLAVQDLYGTTETAELADVVLPAAGWGEKDGTFVSSERRIGVINRVRRPPGQALPDFAIFKLVAEAWGCAEMFDEWASPDAAFQILKRLSAGTPCDITGIVDERHLDAAGGIQWPYPATTPPATAGIHDQPPLCPASAERRLFEDGRFLHADGRARFIVGDPVPPPERADAAYPLVLLTGRGSAGDWHTRTRTSKSALLSTITPRELYVEIHPDDAQARGIEPDSRVVVSSRRGAIGARAFVTPTVQRGQVFIPMHFIETNQLTFPAFDPVSRQPAYKHAAVDVLAERMA